MDFTPSRTIQAQIESHLRANPAGWLCANCLALKLQLGRHGKIMANKYSKQLAAQRHDIEREKRSCTSCKSGKIFTVGLVETVPILTDAQFTDLQAIGTNGLNDVERAMVYAYDEIRRLRDALRKTKSCPYCQPVPMTETEGKDQ